MILIEHRKNKILDLSSVNSKNGVEIDLRSNVTIHGALHLSHDAWILGESFEDWLLGFKKYNIQGPLILNTKEDGLEMQCLEILKKHGLNNFLFLDTQVPTLLKLIKFGFGSHLMTRLSVCEPLGSSLNFKDSIRWLWVDCFDGQPIATEVVAEAKKYFKLCMVAPELQGQNAETLSKFAAIIPFMDAVCTKRPELYA